MRISDQYRQIHDGAVRQLSKLEQGNYKEVIGALHALCNGIDELELHLESVGEIPQTRLEQRLSPVLLSVHAQLDRARVLFESAERNQEAVNVWELEQQIYRLLNDL